MPAADVAVAAAVAAAARRRCGDTQTYVNHSGITGGTMEMEGDVQRGKRGTDPLSMRTRHSRLPVPPLHCQTKPVAGHHTSIAPHLAACGGAEASNGPQGAQLAPSRPHVLCTVGEVVGRLLPCEPIAAADRTTLCVLASACKARALAGPCELLERERRALAAASVASTIGGRRSEAALVTLSAPQGRALPGEPG